MIVFAILIDGTHELVHYFFCNYCIWVDVYYYLGMGLHLRPLLHGGNQERS